MWWGFMGLWSFMSLSEPMILILFTEFNFNHYLLRKNLRVDKKTFGIGLLIDSILVLFALKIGDSN